MKETRADQRREFNQDGNKTMADSEKEAKEDDRKMKTGEMSLSVQLAIIHWGYNNSINLL